MNSLASRQDHGSLPASESSIRSNSPTSSYTPLPLWQVTVPTSCSAFVGPVSTDALPTSCELSRQALGLDRTGSHHRTGRN